MYAAGTTLSPAAVQTVKLAPASATSGSRVATYDRASADYLFVKEKYPRSIFETGIDFAGGTAPNRSLTTDESTYLFDPSSVSTLDFPTSLRFNLPHSPETPPPTSS